MRMLQTVIDNANHDTAARKTVPVIHNVRIGSGRTATLARIPQMPLLIEQGIVWYGTRRLLLGNHRVIELDRLSSGDFLPQFPTRSSGKRTRAHRCWAGKVLQ